MTLGGMTSLSPLRTMAWGLLIVVADVRVDHVDLVPDPVGWLMALVAAWRLLPAHRAFVAAAWACGVGLVVSIPAWLGAEGALVTVTEAVVETVLVFATCTAVMALVPGRRRGADALRWWDLGLTLTLTLLGWYAGASAPDLAPLVILAVVAELVVLVCFLVLLFRAAREAPPAPEKTLQKLP